MKPGTTFGNYTIQSELGSGGFSRVYAARDPRRPEPVALKLLDPGVTASHEGQQRFHREVEAARRLTHRHVVPVYDSGIHAGRAFLVMRLMRGGTLADRLAGGRVLDPGTAARVVRHTARALDHAARHGVIHRDVKPSNIFFHDERTVCLGDFGLAKVHGLGTVTQQGQVIGSVYYMSPEQVRGLAYTGPHSDIYSLGVVLYEMLTGRLPFEGESQTYVLQQIAHGAPVRPSRYSSAVSPAVEGAIMRALSRESNRRYPTAGQLAAAYQKAAGGRRGLAGQSASAAAMVGPAQPNPATRAPRQPGGQAAGRQARRKPAAGKATTDRPEFWVAVLALVAVLLFMLFMST